MQYTVNIIIKRTFKFTSCLYKLSTTPLVFLQNLIFSSYSSVFSFSCPQLLFFISDIKASLPDDMPLVTTIILFQLLNCLSNHVIQQLKRRLFCNNLSLEIIRHGNSLSTKAIFKIFWGRNSRRQ